ncbi:MAG: GNAT family N-acetyltransferase [Gammaproteobacteria bacterium]|nr:GNAT family N-acetyltransferase [Gammaproteobacteria bacterium]
MATPASTMFELQNAAATERFSVVVASNDIERRSCYRLRYNVFANELGADLRGSETGIDKDEFDDHCRHLAVYDNHSREIIATTRLLDNMGRGHAGSFYSETEFDLSNILHSHQRFLEVGRTCIHPDYRRGAALAMLWQGIAKLVVAEKIDYLIGCASVPLSLGDRYLGALMQHVRDHHFAPQHLQVRPLVALRLLPEEPVLKNVLLPTLLKGYLRQGALICGEPYLDAAFGVADVFVLLDCKHINARYTRHFFDRVGS